MISNDKPGILFALALLLEITGVILFLGPFGSSLTNVAWGNWLFGWTVVCGAMLLTPWILRWFGGPKPFRIFSRGKPYKLIRSLYLGLLLGIVFTAYKAMLCLKLRVEGVPFDALLDNWRLWGGDNAFLPAAVLSLVGAYFVFGYIQGLAARVLGEKGGMFLAALLFALGNAWPLDHFAVEIAGIPRWVSLVALYLPAGIGLAYMGTRTRSVFAVLSAVFVMSWLSGLATAIFSSLGALVTAGAMVVMLLVGIEVIVGERRRVKRFVVGFLKDVFSKSEGGFLDSFIFIAAAIGLLFTAWASGLFFAEWYISIVIPAALLIISTILWLVYSIMRRKLPAAKNTE